MNRFGAEIFSTSRPTASCAMAPQTSTRVAMLPMVTSDTSFVMPSSTILGSAMVSTLNTSPALKAMNRNRPNSIAMTFAVKGTAAFDTRFLA